MRYYSIIIRNPATGAVVTYSDAKGSFVDTPGATQTWGSHNNGLFDPNALNVELDVPALPFGTFQGNLAVRVWGVPLSALGQAANLSGYGIEVRGGLQPPFALNQNAKPGQLVVGQIFQGYGNWEGINQTLDLIVANAAVNPNLDANIAFSWAAQTNLADAIVSALTAAFPGSMVVGADAVQRLVQDHDEPVIHDDLLSFCEYVVDRTQQGAYTGIQIRGVGTTFYLYDNSQARAPKQVQFQDLIGQPTWISSAAVSFSCVMRGDLQLGDSVALPAGLFPPYLLTTPNPAAPIVVPSNRIGFLGNLTVTEAHHFGNFRQADAESWRTEFVGVPNLSDPNALAGEPQLPAGALS